MFLKPSFQPCRQTPNRPSNTKCMICAFFWKKDGFRTSNRPPQNEKIRGLLVKQLRNLYSFRKFEIKIINLKHIAVDDLQFELEFLILLCSHRYFVFCFLRYIYMSSVLNTHILNVYIQAFCFTFVSFVFVFNCFGY